MPASAVAGTSGFGTYEATLLIILPQYMRLLVGLSLGQRLQTALVVSETPIRNDRDCSMTKTGFLRSAVNRPQRLADNDMVHRLKTEVSNGFLTGRVPPIRHAWPGSKRVMSCEDTRAGGSQDRSCRQLAILICEESFAEWLPCLLGTQKG